jgi:hypothetical protein
MIFEMIFIKVIKNVFDKKEAIGISQKAID